MKENGALIPVRNNFDLVRIIFAIDILFYHLYALSAIDLFRYLHFDSTAVVRGFFVISGFLIFRSYENTGPLKDFFVKRIRRIYPAYCCAIVIFALVLSLFSLEGAGHYFTSRGLARYVTANLLFMNFLAPCLPGVFVQNPLCAVNGALWTMKIEVMFYAVLPGLVWLLRKYHKAAVFACLYLASCLYVYYFRNIHVSEELSKQLPAQLPYFLSGGMIFYYFEHFKRYRHIAMAAASILLISSYLVDIPYTIPFSLSVVILYVVFFVPASLAGIGKIGDISYGIYIFHFPVIQIFVQTGLLKNHPVTAVPAILAIVLTLALLSWHLVEKRLLKRTSHYVRPT